MNFWLRITYTATGRQSVMKFHTALLRAAAAFGLASQPVTLRFEDH